MKILGQRGLLLALVFVSVLIGNAYTILDYFPFQHGVDCDDYLKMAQGDFNVSLVRRYRVIVPMVSGAFFSLVSGFLPSAYHLKALLGSFFVVNVVLMTLASIYLFKLSLRHGASFIPAFIAVMAIIASRWAGYITGHPYTDSLYLLSITLFFYHIRSPNPYLQLSVLILGLFAKESFLLFFPLFFVFSTLKVASRVGVMAGSIIVYFLFRYGMDTFFEVPLTASLSKDMEHGIIILDSLIKIFTPFGLGILFAVHSFFNLIFLFDIPQKGRNFIQSLHRMERPLLFLPPIIFVHMLLSGTVDRMYFFIAPFFVVLLSTYLEGSNLLRHRPEKLGKVNF